MSTERPEQHGTMEKHGIVEHAIMANSSLIKCVAHSKTTQGNEYHITIKTFPIFSKFKINQIKIYLIFSNELINIDILDRYCLSKNEFILFQTIETLYHFMSYSTRFWSIFI